MRVLLVGRSGLDTPLPNGHVLVFLESAGNPPTLDATSFEFVFLHINNVEALTLVEDWQTDGNAMKLILFSAGLVDAAWRSKGLPFISDVGRLERLDWSNVPADFAGTSADLAAILLPPALHLLFSFCVLCQGYLSATASLVDDPTTTPASIADARERMGWNAAIATEEGRRAAAAASAHNDLVQTPQWWAAALGPAVYDVEFLARFQVEWNEALHGACPRSILRLIAAIQFGETVSGVTVAESYLAITDRLAAGSRR